MPCSHFIRTLCSKSSANGKIAGMINAVRINVKLYFAVQITRRIKDMMTRMNGMRYFLVLTAEAIVKFLLLI
ncbi:hypothetical protein SDC9_210211 [bioreactor metagenome]|uniref:Uncharacterized protein n=1 Tax=bioreactor metagenome TaxID=1076179 RepID=A0A645JGW6_9ZZZZ